MSALSILASLIVSAVIVGAWVWIAYQVWTHQELNRRHMVDDIRWDPRQGRRE